MSTDLTRSLASTSPESTMKLAEAIGARLKGGEVIELVSDLGGGKTIFTKGLVKGAGSQDDVTSPTFTLRNEYKAGDLTIYHFDFYRLSEPGIMADELAEVIGDTQAVTIVEWADVVENILPSGRLTVRIAATGENSRKLTFNYPEKLSYLIPKE